MNYIGNDKKLYDEIQAEIRALMKPYPPLLFDLLAWNTERKLIMRKNKPYQLKVSKKYKQNHE